METKEIITLIGILLVLMVSIYNIVITLKNRRNVIREHLFKEQIIIHYKIFAEFSKLNNEVDSLKNNSEKRYENNFHEKITAIDNLLTENEFLLENETISLINETISEAMNFYLEIITADSIKVEKAYKKYYQKYFDILNFSRNSFGTDSLSAENKNLHTRNIKNGKLLNKIITESLEIATQTIIRL